MLRVLIVEHASIGGFMTHYGWNSTLEGIVPGKAMVTWPVALVQFYNEKGKKGKGMRRKAKELGKMAKTAVEEGGYSHFSLNDLIDELKRQPWL
ncbi:unnamed protein product [Linum tenue]|uniref:Uncharacterized protein n=1 Tax=Linum tenue TaxID=586396 RepID=A0AAV0MGI8_9ROSI|nr:unnamed protein product [Linum tenue]